MDRITINSTCLGIQNEQVCWRVTLEYQGRQWTTNYSQGLGWVLHQKHGIAPKGSVRLNLTADQKAATRSMKVSHLFAGSVRLNLTVDQKVMVVKSKAPYGGITVADLEGSFYAQVPKLEDVLYCLQRDAAEGEYLLFEDFADEFGFDTDSRKAEKIWRGCQETRGQLQKLFGSDFDEFMSIDYDQ